MNVYAANRTVVMMIDNVDRGCVALSSAGYEKAFLQKPVSLSMVFPPGSDFFNSCSESISYIVVRLINEMENNFVDEHNTICIVDSDESTVIKYNNIQRLNRYPDQKPYDHTEVLWKRRLTEKRTMEL